MDTDFAEKERHERREQKRVYKTLPASLMIEGIYSMVIVTDLSKGGCHLYSEINIQEDEIYQISFFKANKDLDVHQCDWIKCNALRVDNKEDQWFASFKFIDKINDRDCVEEIINLHS